MTSLSESETSELDVALAHELFGALATSNGSVMVRSEATGGFRILSKSGKPRCVFVPALRDGCWQVRNVGVGWKTISTDWLVFKSGGVFLRTDRWHYADECIAVYADPEFETVLGNVLSSRYGVRLHRR